MTKRALVIAATLVITLGISVHSLFSVNAQSRSCRVRTLPGYSCKTQDTLGVLSAAGVISRPGGLRIDFEEGMSQGIAADAGDGKDYTWYREQTLKGQLVKLAMIKNGLKTVWEPDQPRNAEFGSILLVSFPLGNQPNHAINFKAEILSDEDLVDALLMILTFPGNK